jgi:ParB/RepB/Spo0J family partition protein
MTKSEKKTALGRGMYRLRGLEALTSAMASPVSLDILARETSQPPLQGSVALDSSQNLDLKLELPTALNQEVLEKAPVSKNLSIEQSAELNIVLSITDDKDELEQNSSFQVRFLALNTIYANPSQPRKFFAREELDDLVESIEKVGLLQPIVVRPLGKNYEIVAGERRWRAAQEANLERIPAIVRILDDSEAFQLALIENVQRQQLNPIEEARGYFRLIEEFGMTQEGVSNVVGKKRASIANTLRLLQLDDEVIVMLESGEISQGHAKVILSVKDKA